MYKRKIIGITGGLESDKTLMAGRIQEKCKERNEVSYTIDTKKMVNKILETDIDVRSDLFKILGEYNITDEGKIDYALLYKEMTKSGDILERCRYAIGPKLIWSILDRLRYTEEDSTIIILSSVLFEMNLDSVCDWIYYLTREHNELFNMLVEKGYTENQVNTILCSYMTPKEKKQASNLIINFDKE